MENLYNRDDLVHLGLMCVSVGMLCGYVEDHEELIYVRWKGNKERIKIGSLEEITNFLERYVKLKAFL